MQMYLNARQPLYKKYLIDRTFLLGIDPYGLQCFFLGCVQI